MHYDLHHQKELVPDCYIGQHVKMSFILGMAMLIYLPMRINADIRIIRHMSDIAQYMRIMRILMRISAVPYGHP